jgi:hypothetical protein
MEGLNFRMTALNIADDPTEQVLGSNADSMTLGQLRNALNGSQTKVKAQQFAMRYEDEDSVFDEIEEFMSYQEVQQLSYNLSAWEGSFRGGAS